MATGAPQNQPKGFNLSFPTSITLKDVISVISVAVSLTVAWGVFSTRITVLEKDHERTTKIIQEQQIAISNLSKRIRKTESNNQDDALLLDQIFITLRRPLPQRRSNNVE